MAMQLPIKKTHEELQVETEAASGVIAEYLAFCAKEVFNEESLALPNLEKIETLEAQLLKLKKEKLAIARNDFELIKKALYIYAPLLKKRVEV